MARTPDRRPGETDEEGIVLENRPSGEDPTSVGGIRYVDGAFRFKDAIGLFNPRTPIPGGANTEVQFNSNGILSGSSLFTFNSSTGAVTASYFTGSFAKFSFLTATSLSGSLTKLADGTSYLIAGNNIGIASGSNGSIVISATSTATSEYFFSTTAGSIYTTGSVAFVGNQSGVDSPYDFGSDVNFYVSGSLTSNGADDPSIVFAGDTFISGAFGVSDYIQLKPVGSVRIPTNTTASYLYTSGSTNDLYYTQYQPGTGYTNTVRMRWHEGTLTTGLLHGGVLSTQNGTTTFSITSGSALIVNYNASTTTDPYPTAVMVDWPTYVSQSLTYSGSAQITYIGINSSGGIIQQTSPFSGNDFTDRVVIGRILHQTGSVTNGTITSPVVAYAQNLSNDQFIRAFGPLKVSGHFLSNSGSNLSLAKTSGTSYVVGRNYTSNPDSPNLVLPVTDVAPTVSKIFREYVSGSTPVIDTGIAAAGYPVIDPTLYNDNGTLSAVSAGQFTIQRVFWYPNSVNKAFYVYYGNATYATLDLAEAGIVTESFTEGENTQEAAVYLGAVLVKGNATDLSNAAQARFVQGGLFRNAGQTGGGGGAAVTVPGGLDTYVQFNDGGSTFGGDAGLTYNKTTDTLSVVNVSMTATADQVFSLRDNSAGALNISAGVGDNRWTFNTGDGQERLGFWDGVRASFGDINDPDLNIQHDGTNSTITNKTGLLILSGANGLDVTGSTKFAQGLSGSLTKLTDGTSYLIAGSNVTIATGSNGSITLAAPNLASSAAAFVTIGNDATLSNERALTSGTGLTLTDGGANSTVTLEINNNVVATISGSTFTGAVNFNQGLSGSLTKLTSGTDYLLAGSNVTLSTGSSGAVTISAPNLAPSTSAFVTIGNDSTLSNERALATGTGLALTDGGANSNVTLAINNNVVATISGSTFTGAVNFNAGLSGSLTRLTDGSSYLIAGANIGISTGSNGAVTISNTAPTFYQWNELTPSPRLNTTASVSMAGGLGSAYAAESVGSDVYFFVSGSTSSTYGASVFGGDLVASGTLQTQTITNFSPISTTTALTLNGSSRGTSGTGRGIALASAVGTTTVGGGTLSFTAGNSGGASSTGGNVTIDAGSSSSSAAAGDIFVRAGDTSSTTAGTRGGNITLAAGSIPSGGSGTAGRVDITTGAAANAAATPGNITLTAQRSKVIIRRTTTTAPAGTDTFFFVTGSVGVGVTDKSVFTGEVYVSGSVTARSGLSGSLTTLVDGTPYLLAGTNIALTTGSSGAVTVAWSSPSNNVLGTGTTNYVAKFTGASTIGDAVIYDTGTNVGIGTASPVARFEVSGSSTSTSPVQIVRAGLSSPTAAIFDVQNVNSTSLVFVSGSGELGLSSNSVLQTATATTTTTSATTLMTISSTTYRSAEFVLHGVDTTGGKYMTTKVLAIHNGTTSNHTEYGQVNVGGIAGTVSVTNPSAGSFLLQVTPASTNSTVWRVTAILTRA